MHFARLTLARTARWLMLAVLVSLVPATSHAGVFISVGFAPPPLVVYDQPPCPEAGWMWEPGYWAYGDDGYYWVPGTWVPAPEPGMYWTPGYWGFANALYVWHPGYWGPHVGYYGGVNYGFGFFGVGFVGGMWRGNVFAYNTAVVHVNRDVIRNVYVDRNVIRTHTVVDNHVAYSGGPGGIHHPPTPEERSYMNERHIAPTSYQTEHAQAAMHDRNAYFKANHGHPATVAAERPMTANRTQPMYQDNKMGGTNPHYENKDQMARPNNQQQERQQEMQRQQQSEQRNQQQMQRQQQTEQRNQQTEQRQQQTEQREQEKQQQQMQRQQQQQEKQQQQMQREQRTEQRQQQQEQRQVQPRPQPQERQAQPREERQQPQKEEKPKDNNRH